ncbi:MAG: hypothetical protein K2N05_05955 [Muribaculaceae bacterium]|nr:hypothetical protein [Muribaculaceae bacterium]
MGKRSKQLKLVGVLQDLGCPFVSLYVDMANEELYVFTLFSSPTSKEKVWSVVNVSPQEVEYYLNENLGLLDLYSDKKEVWYVIKTNGEFVFSEAFQFIPSHNMECLNKYDPELCVDDIWIETFLKRVKHNHPLEIY